ncbi:hypothetical protein TSOC_005184, partial [Tetrabaena socialis]
LRQAGHSEHDDDHASGGAAAPCTGRTSEPTKASRLPRPAGLLELPGVPGGRRRRARRRAEQQVAEVEEALAGAPARGPREDVPGPFTAFSWLAARLAVGGAVAALLSPSGPLAVAAAYAATAASKVVGGRLGYELGRRSVARACCGMAPEACVEYAMMCDAGPFSPEDDICRWRPVYCGRPRDWRRRGSGAGGGPQCQQDIGAGPATRSTTDAPQ